MNGLQDITDYRQLHSSEWEIPNLGVIIVIIILFIVLARGGGRPPYIVKHQT